MRNSTWKTAFPVLAMLLVALSVCLLGNRLSRAQTTADTKKSKIKKPEDIVLTTKDGIKLHCTYYPGGMVQTSAEKGKEDFKEKPGKSVVPIVLIHSHKGKRSDFESLALNLQRLGHAVLVPDLRGHGQSSKPLLPGKREWDVEKLGKDDLAAMTLDWIAIKRFLRTENNQEKLNLELLCLVGAEMGASLAVAWADYDWSLPTIPAYKPGKDVKAVVLLSPVQQFRGLNISTLLGKSDIRGLLAFLVAVGEEDPKAFTEAKTVYNRVEKLHPGLETLEPKDRPVFLIPLKTQLQGTKLLTSNALPIQQNIATFINWRLVDYADRLTWSKRENPLETE